jgi:hypothetical protein
MNMNANTNQGGYGNNPYQGYWVNTSKYSLTDFLYHKC